jgi:hypothetical protein
MCQTTTNVVSKVDQERPTDFKRTQESGISPGGERVAELGEVEVVNRPLLEYFGKDFEEIRNWANTDAIYPDDLPHAIEAFNNSLPCPYRKYYPARMPLKSAALTRPSLRAQ